MAKRIFAIPDENGVITVLCGMEMLDIVVVPPGGGGPGGSGPDGSGPTGGDRDPTGGGGGPTGSGGTGGSGGFFDGSGGKLGGGIFDDPAAAISINEAWRQRPVSLFSQLGTYYYTTTRPVGGGSFDVDAFIADLGAELHGQNIPTPRAIVVGGLRGIDIHDVAALSGRIQTSYSGAGIGFDFWKLKP